MTERKTKSKKLIKEIFRKSQVPLTLNEVYSKVNEILPDIAYSTVFRIVQNMTKNKQLVSLDFKERGGRFEWAARYHHHHLICTNCGNVKDIEDSIINFRTDRISKETGFSIHKHSIELLGTCPPCKQNE